MFPLATFNELKQVIATVARCVLHHMVEWIGLVHALLCDRIVKKEGGYPLVVSREIVFVLILSVYVSGAFNTAFSGRVVFGTKCQADLYITKAWESRASCDFCGVDPN